MPKLLTKVKSPSKIVEVVGKLSLKRLLLNELRPAPPALEFSIKVFKSVIKPVEVVSQNISKRLSTGSVSITAKYCMPGVSELTIVSLASKVTLTGSATPTGGVASFSFPTFILAGV